jgi:PPM family protein phosphatase
MNYRLIAAGATHVGQKRDENEDAYHIDVEHGLFVAADGMGGRQRGAAASAAAVDTMTYIPSFPTFHPDGVTEGFQVANQEIRALANGASRAPATTATVLWINTQRMGEDEGTNGECTAIIGHIGDSRAYQVGHGVAHQLTTDHSHVQSLVLRSSITATEAKTHRYRNVVLRGLLGNDHYWPDILCPYLESRNTFLLCSDGLTDEVDLDSKVARTILAKLEDAKTNEELQEACDALVDLANQNGGSDNITVILVKLIWVAE